MEYILKLMSFIAFGILFIFCVTNIKIERIKANRHLKYLKKQIKKHNIKTYADAIQILNNTKNILNKL